MGNKKLESRGKNDRQSDLKDIYTQWMTQLMNGGVNGANRISQFYSLFSVLYLRNLRPRKEMSS